MFIWKLTKKLRDNSNLVRDIIFLFWPKNKIMLLPLKSTPPPPKNANSPLYINAIPIPRNKKT
jgi:hypothetical protein